jgi:outer membrane protein insertion porin family
VLAVGVLIPASPAAAQVTGADVLTQAQGPFQGRPIRRVVLRRPAAPTPGAPPETQTYEPLDPALEQLTRNQLRLLPGSAFDAETLRGDLSRLNRLARFRTIEISGELLADGSMDLIYTLTPQPVISAVQTVGNRRFSDQEILADLDVLVGTPVDRFQLDRAVRFIEDKYRARGYYMVQVDVDEKELEATGAVIFRVREGERVRVTEVRFEGNRTYSESELRGAVRTRPAWLLGRGLLDDDRLESDVASLIDFYRDRGHLSVRADRVVRPSRDGREASVTFVIDEGPVFLLRRVDVFYEDLVSGVFPSEREARAAAGEGEHVLPIGPQEYAVFRMGRFTPEQIAGLMRVKPGDVYSVARVDQSVESVREAFAKLGYIDLRIERRERRDPAAPEVDVLLVIRQGRAFRTGLVEIQGNEITRDGVIRGELEIRPERPVDAGAIRRSERNLRDLRLFDPRPEGVKITVQPERPEHPGYRDVLVEVRETNTGEFAIGGAVGSDSGVTGRLALTQRNFDLADWPDSFSDFFSGRAFRGAGQTFSIEALPGSEIQTYSISLADPTLLDTDYTGSATLFFRDRIYRRYDEQRYGARFALGRRLGRRWSLSMPVRIESIDLTDVDPDAPTDVFAVADRNVLTSVALSLSRAAVDDRVLPTTGTSVRLSAEQAGIFGGDYDFTTLSAEGNLFLPVAEDFLGRRTVLSFSGRVAYAPQGRDEVPIYERFYLGGSSMRGFAFRSIAPIGIRNDTGGIANTTVGGTWLFFAGAELRRPLYSDMLYGVLFLDTGTVLFDPGFEDYRASAGFGFRIRVPGLSPIPIALDFGFPILREDTDRRRLFTFSIDLPF